MTRETVQDPEGVQWSVARRVLPWRPRFRRERIHPLEMLDGITFLLQVLSLPLLLVEVLLASLLVLPRVALGKPWRVEATTPGPPRQRLIWRIHGFANAGAHVHDVARGIASHGAGPTPPDDRRIG